jgi:hypothetical protein
MKKRNHTFIGLIITIIIAASLLTFGSSAHAPIQKSNNCTCCKENSKDCAGKNNSNAPGEMIMESLSRQFLSLTISAY